MREDLALFVCDREPSPLSDFPERKEEGSFSDLVLRMEERDGEGAVFSDFDVFREDFSSLGGVEEGGEFDCPTPRGERGERGELEAMALMT